MGIPANYELANDSEFRLISNFTTPPRAGRITVIEANGQVRVATDDPDGGDVLAWPLNGFSYAVDDVVYIAFAANNPESAIVIGAKAPLPTLAAGVLPEAYVPVDGSDPLTGDWDIGEDRRILAEGLRARDGEGLKLEDDAGNLGIFVKDGGAVLFGNDDATADGNAPLTLSSATTFLDAIRHANNTAGPLFRLKKSRSGSVGTHTIVQSGDQIGAYLFQGSDGTAFRTGAQIRAEVDGTPGAGSMPGRLILATTADGQVAATERVRVDSQGNVSIGTSPAQGKLHVHDGTGGMIFVTKSAISNVAQTIIPNGSGDVTGAITGFFVLDDGSGAVANAFTMIPGDNLDVLLGGYTLRLALNANGALTAIRHAGTGTATLALFAIWL